MRKADPDSVRDSFRSDIGELGSFYSRAASSLAGTPHEKADLSRLAEGVFVSSSVLLEAFLSDLFIVYINRDGTELMAHEQERASQSLSAKLSPWYAQKTKFPSTKHIPVADLRTHLDSGGYNLTFRNADTLKQRAKEWLVATYASGFAQLAAADCLLLDAVKSIRDYLAHKSSAAHSAMNDCLVALEAEPGNSGMGRQTNRVNNVGAFLKALVAGRARILNYFDRLEVIAGQL